MNWRIAIVVARGGGDHRETEEHIVSGASQLSAAAAALAEGIGLHIAADDELLIFVEPAPTGEHSDGDHVEVIMDLARPNREDEPQTEAYRTYSLMLSHIWQSQRTDPAGAPRAAQNAAWAENDQRKLETLAASGKGLTPEEKEIADRRQAESQAREAEDK